MGIIKKLSIELVSKIAAGEVIERPSSIVKELLENAVDAGADKIEVELRNGGIDLIRIHDNGTGMLKEDIELAVQRHTTSKLYSESELYAIETLGFRGEALYSIGVISDLEIITKHKNEEIGTIINVRGGDIINKTDIAHDKGTTVTVSNLFFNTPARKKFLGSPQAEYRACLDVVDRFVFGYKNIGIRLVNNSKEVFNIQPAQLETRAILRIDQRLKNKLYDVHFDNGIIRVEGYISDPDYNTNSSRFLYIFVNGRYIIDKSLNYSITNAYSTALERGRYPVAVINLFIPHNFVDVNINPTKTAVKFADRSMVNDAVSNAIRDSINKRAIVYTSLEQEATKNKYKEQVKEAVESYITFNQHTNNTYSGYGTLKKMHVNPTLQDANPDTKSNSVTTIQRTILKNGGFSSLNIYAQFNATYIIASSSDSLVLIDQHAMHERIIFEKLLKNLQARQRQSQFLTAPQEIFLNEKRMSIIMEIQDALNRIGYELSIGNNSVHVRAIPAGTVFTPLSLIELIDNISQKDASSHTELTDDQKTDPLYRIMADVACKSAVRAGDFLPLEKIKALFMQLDQLGIPLNCPHGRPFVFILPKAEIEKFFHRRL